jgi:hypothetical protein
MPGADRSIPTIVQERELARIESTELLHNPVTIVNRSDVTATTRHLTS